MIGIAMKNSCFISPFEYGSLSFFFKTGTKQGSGLVLSESTKLDNQINYDFYEEDYYEEYEGPLEVKNLKEIQELEIEITENTTNVRHCNTSDDCYKIYRDANMECVTQATSAQKSSHGTSFGICKYPGCKRNNDNCYHGELCIKNNCVPVSEVICYE